MMSFRFKNHVLIVGDPVWVCFGDYFLSGFFVVENGAKAFKRTNLKYFKVKSASRIGVPLIARFRDDRSERSTPLNNRQKSLFGFGSAISAQLINHNDRAEKP